MLERSLVNTPAVLIFDPNRVTSVPLLLSHLKCTFEVAGLRSEDRGEAGPRGERGEVGQPGPPGEAGNSNLRAFDVDEDMVSCCEDEVAVSAICKGEVTPPVLLNGKVLCKGATGIVGLCMRR